MPQKIFAVAMIDALAYALEQDPQVVVIGASSFLLDRGLPEEVERRLFDRFPTRLIDPPTSEGAATSLATGAAVAGMRPFLNYGTATFAYEAYNQILSEAANVHAMSNGQLRAPLVLHMYAGIRGGGAAQHSSSPQAMYANAAGLELVLPSSPADAQGLVRSAIRSDNPTIVITHTKLLRMTGGVPDGDFSIPFGKAEVTREGRDVTIVATSLMVHEALAASVLLAKDGIEAEVVDPRTIVPLDADTICASVAKTGRLVTVDEGNAMCCIGSEISALVAEHAFAALKAPIMRIARPAVPVPFSPPLEAYLTPNADKIAMVARKAVGASN
jgi:acetoin:2,6-dichlorophenolindophenol oxidoreductase subunit beta